MEWSLNLDLGIERNCTRLWAILHWPQLCSWAFYYGACIGCNCTLARGLLPMGLLALLLECLQIKMLVLDLSKTPDFTDVFSFLYWFESCCKSSWCGGELVMVNYNYSALIFENVFLHVDEKVADMVSKQEKLWPKLSRPALLGYLGVSKWSDVATDILSRHTPPHLKQLHEDLRRDQLQIVRITRRAAQCVGTRVVTPPILLACPITLWSLGILHKFPQPP